MSKYNLADAVRVLLYGNGDLYRQIEGVARLLAIEDGTRPSGFNKLELIAERLEHLEEYDYFSGEEWNK